MNDKRYKKDNVKIGGLYTYSIYDNEIYVYTGYRKDSAGMVFYRFFPISKSIFGQKDFETLRPEWFKEVVD